MAKTTPATPAAAAGKEPVPVVETTSTLVNKANVRLAFINEDGTETAAAVELPQSRIDEMLRTAQSSLGMSSKESTVSYVLHEFVLAKMDRLPNID